MTDIILIFSFRTNIICFFPNQHHLVYGTIPYRTAEYEKSSQQVGSRSDHQLQHSVVAMSHKPFFYNDDLLKECAISNFAARLVLPASSASSGTTNQVLGSVSDESAVTVDASCRLLFEQHALHFGRRPVAGPNNDDDGDGDDYTTRIHNFVRNVVFVHNHNTAAAAAATMHRVGLNQFSDLRLNEILPIASSEDMDIVSDEEEAADETRSKHSSRWLWEQTPAALWEAQQKNGNSNIMINGINLGSANFTRFTSHQQILDVAAAANFLMVVGQEGYAQGHNHEMNHARQIHDDDDVVTASGAIGEIDNGDFTTYLNWATKDNPDGVPLVNAPIDQVRSMHSYLTCKITEDFASLCFG
jgi:Cathepsin propeptide inhibitor domain (I29)